MTSAAETPYDAAVALEAYLCCTSRVDDGQPILDENGTPIPLFPFDPLIPEAPPLIRRDFTHHPVAGEVRSGRHRPVSWLEDFSGRTGAQQQAQPQTRM